MALRLPELCGCGATNLVCGANNLVSVQGSRPFHCVQAEELPRSLLTFPLLWQLPGGGHSLGVPRPQHRELPSTTQVQQQTVKGGASS